MCGLDLAFALQIALLGDPRAGAADAASLWVLISILGRPRVAVRTSIARARIHDAGAALHVGLVCDGFEMSGIYAGRIAAKMI
jgi:hypothetical protein